MICTSSLYEECRELFARYPLATYAADPRGKSGSSMILLLRDGDDARFFMLTHHSRGGTTSYSLRSLPAGDDIADIEADGRATVPDVVVDAVTRAVPIPQDGSLFGWTCDNVVTALVAVYASYMSASLEPNWATMPLAGIPEVEWPPFVGERLFGYWFWEHYRLGKVILLDDLIAETSHTVYWVEAKATLGSDICAVAHDVKNKEGLTLRQGLYVYHQALQAEKSLPPVSTLLADTSKIDLAPRFR